MTIFKDSYALAQYTDKERLERFIRFLRDLDKRNFELCSDDDFSTSLPDVAKALEIILECSDKTLMEYNGHYIIK